MNIRTFISIVLILPSVFITFAQPKVAITIDDIPNTRVFKKHNFESKLLSTLDSVNIPVTIFINEGHIYKNENVSENFDLLNQWITREFITVGNHTFSHMRYSDVGMEKIGIDILKGERITRELSKLYGKELKYFRFPYNDLGRDSVQHTKIDKFLEQNNYTLTPFTIESMDYMFNYVYYHYLKRGKIHEAENIAEQYIEKTLEYFAYFDSISLNQYGRQIAQIYLCHDNYINADYFYALVIRLIDEGYSFVNIEEAMKDPVYRQPTYYFEKWGISWIYRWMNNKDKRKQLMKNEPDATEIYKVYQELISR